MIVNHLWGAVIVVGTKEGFCLIFKPMIPLRHIVVLLCLFAVTLAIRWPNLGRPMSKHHEFCTATALRVLTVWHQEGIASKGYNPATNFAGAANKYINNHASGSGQMVDAEGNYYYVSHPPLAYYLPYAVFSALHIEPDVLPLQYFNLFINLLCGFGIYLLARRLLPESSWAGPLAVTIYWFTPAVLWFQSNVYMSDMMAQPFYIAALLLTLYVINKPRPLTIAALAIVCFLGTYTTWFGLLVAGSLGLYFLFKALNRPAYFWVVGLLVLSQVLALGLMAWQYSQIAGWDAYMAELGHRFGVRGGADGGVPINIMIQLFNYISNYGILLLAPLILWFFSRNRESMPPLKTFLCLGLLPIVLMHLLLANYAGHDFTTLFLSVPLSVGVAVAAVSLAALDYRNIVIKSTLIIAIIIGPVLYFIANPYGEKSFNNEYYHVLMSKGQKLALEPTDAALFYVSHTPSIETLWYAKRNVKNVASEEEALYFLKKHGINKGIMFERNNWNNYQKTKTIYLQPDN